MEGALAFTFHCGRYYGAVSAAVGEALYWPDPGVFVLVDKESGGGGVAPVVDLGFEPRVRLARNIKCNTYT